MHAGVCVCGVLKWVCMCLCLWGAKRRAEAKAGKGVAHQHWNSCVHECVSSCWIVVLDLSVAGMKEERNQE